MQGALRGFKNLSQSKQSMKTLSLGENKHTGVGDHNTGEANNDEV